MPPEFPPIETTTAQSTNSVTKRGANHRTVAFSILGGLCILGAMLLWFITGAPGGAYPKAITVAEGMTVREITEAAKSAGVVRSGFVLYATLTLRHDPTTIYAGTYTIDAPQNVFSLAHTLADGQIESETVALTLPEGMSVSGMSTVVATVLPNIAATDYAEAAVLYEGTLFPETYYVPPTFTTAELIALQRATYEERVGLLRERIAGTPLTEAEVITLASIVEREANDETSMRMVAGILRNRLDIGMPLQADATMEYALETPLGELAPGELAEALREVDSPYNTYLYRGLPPTPIGNPGLTAIEAVIEPTPSPHLFYITGTDGNFYYAETLDEHNDNIARYLR